LGVEEFTVRIESSWSPDQVISSLLKERGATVVECPHLPAYTVLRIEDSLHIFEVEVGPRPSGVSVAIRFALCHPSSVDDTYVDHIEWMARRFSGRVKIAEDVTPRNPNGAMEFNSSALQHLRISVVDCVREKRQLWQNDFGTTAARLTCDESLWRFVMGGQDPPS